MATIDEMNTDTMGIDRDFDNLMKATPNASPAPCAGKIWTCKIGETGRLPMGADGPMRTAVRAAYLAITGEEPAFLFSGWGAELTEPERAVVENRMPNITPPDPCDGCKRVNAAYEKLHDENRDLRTALGAQPAAAPTPSKGGCHHFCPRGQEERDPCIYAYHHSGTHRCAHGVEWESGSLIPFAQAMDLTHERRAADSSCPTRDPVVWADAASPFTGAQVLDLLKENEKLRSALRPFAERVVGMGMPRAKVDKDDLWVTIGFAQSVWLNAAKVLVK